ncbi:hypothetical protein QQS21_003275 [Conoideocrella luteorostrata]|uniref:Rhodopsin domain-containing protein n=1 Tax=Conoideocrella luteorostrata TaxID=1105319 RepID=A0AAJ0CTL6_9HYPO|nr:hypothetical protein QQS21_003275 [Conoideocrella luteorostrata]
MASDPALPAGLDPNKVPAASLPTPPPENWAGLGSGPELHTTTVVMFAILAPIAIFSVGLRFHWSWRTRGSPGGGINAADWCSLGALVLTLCQESIIMTLGDYQRHQWDMPLAKMLIPSFYKRTYAQYVIAWPAISLAKLSILLLYLRIFRMNKTLRMAIWGGVALICVAYLPNIAVSSYFCAARVGEAWGPVVGLRCADRGSLKWLIASAALSVLLDFYILVLPIPQIMSLKMSVRRRLGVCLIFFTAFFACTCAILTLVYRIQLEHAQDTLWPGAQLWITNLVENFVAIIVSSVPGVSSWLTRVLMPSQFYSRISSFLSGSSRSAFSQTQSQTSDMMASDQTNNNYPMRNYAQHDPESQSSLTGPRKLDGSGGIQIKQTYTVLTGRP